MRSLPVLWGVCWSSLLSISIIWGGCRQSSEGDIVSLEGVEESLCSSGKFWVGGEKGSPLMWPGGDCIGCHIDRGEGPRYTTAGTVFSQPGEVDNCLGVEGAAIHVTDATGQRVTMYSNSAGNFYSRKPMTPPYKASVEYQGRTLEMFTPFSDLNCATCHTAEGLFGAPGRVFVP